MTQLKKIVQNRGQKDCASNGNKDKKKLCVLYVVLIKRAPVMSRTLNIEMSRQTLSSVIYYLKYILSQNFYKHDILTRFP